ncbi:MAG: hypothetical protein COA94_00045 [Rickettsiales bacterium]|nr:MAG: hypothetical protein COA94_00045 [Rickettsiales bacterium]
MKTSAKQTGFILLGLALIAMIFTLTQMSSATAAKKNGKKFGDWVVSCSPANKKTKTPAVCVLTQQINMSKDDKQQTVALFQIGYFGKKKDLKLVQTLPFGISIEAGTSIISSKKLIAPGKYTTCLASGCQAVASISKKDLKTMTSNSENAVAFMSLNGKQITFPISMKGIERGLKYIK